MTDNKNNYISDQVQRTLKATKALAGKETCGMSPSELAGVLKTSRANVTRLLANLEQVHYAERLPSNPNLWRLGKDFVQIANTVARNFTQTTQQLQIDQRNYSLVV